MAVHSDFRKRYIRFAFNIIYYLFGAKDTAKTSNAPKKSPAGTKRNPIAE
ncbi:hypothetical protein ACQKFG_18100 [Peribacillus sp. NPDC076916]